MRLPPFQIFFFDGFSAPLGGHLGAVLGGLALRCRLDGGTGLPALTRLSDTPDTRGLTDPCLLNILGNLWSHD